MFRRIGSHILGALAGGITETGQMRTETQFFLG